MMTPETQARKFLSDRSPFDSEEQASGIVTLPFSVAAHLSRSSDGRRKFKKSASSSHGDAAGAGASAAPPAASPPAKKSSASAGIWPHVEDYFREVSSADIDLLVPVLSLGDPVFAIPRDAGAETAASSVEIKEEEVAEVKEEVKEEEEEEEGSSMSWLLGSKHRVLLTTQRPTKKRKLLGTDAGLDQLLFLPHPQPCSARCDVCCIVKSEEKAKKFVTCSSCGVLVHKKCYGLHGFIEDTWLCAWCKHLDGSEDSVKNPCSLCPIPGGALKLADGKSEGKKRFAHLFCCLWTPEVYVEDTGEMEPIMNVEGVQETRAKLVCNVCKVKQGICVRCSFGTCRTAFHPICAREARHRLEIWGKFGCNNVELRAFCGKHSSLQDSCPDGTQQKEHLTRSVCDGRSPSNAPSQPTVVKKLPKLKLTCKNKDKSSAQVEVKGSKSNDLAKDSPTLEQDTLDRSCSPKGGEVKLDKNMIVGVPRDDDSSPDVSNLIVFFKKLLDRGKIVIGDVASEMGIPSDTLEAALKDEISSFSPELRLKITKWLQNSVHMPSSIRHSKLRSGSAIGHGKFEDTDNVNHIRAKSLPPRRRTKTNIRILKDKNVCSAEEKHEESCNEVLGNEIGGVSTGHLDQANDTSSDAHENRSGESKATLGTISEETAPDSSSCQDIKMDFKGNSAEVKEQSQAHDMEEHDPVDHSTCQADEANITSDGTINNIREEKNCKVDMGGAVSATPDLKFGGCSSYVHPYIQKRLMQAHRDITSQQKDREAGVSENPMSQTIGSCDRSSYSTSSETNHSLEVVQLAQLSKARDTGVLEFSPEDELEGEMLYLQNKLLNSAVAIKHRYEDLIGKIVQKLPEEVAALKRRRWNLVLVNQYLREVREAKKWGRKERKHKEAQAVLAAAAAAAAASSRNPLLRKDASDENPLANVPSGRVSGHSPLGPRLKETPRSGIVKVLPNKDSGIFRIAEFSKESELSCDICRRPETLLSRIFVCSSCKVAVHLDCYRMVKDPVSPWKCELCEEISQSGSPRSQTLDSRDKPDSLVECQLCGGSSGAFRKTIDGRWLHAFCAEWLLEPAFRRGQQDSVEGMDALPKEKDSLPCGICQRKFGICSKCSYGNCQVTFHPLCARTAGFYMNVKAIGGKLNHKAYCEKHSLEQRQKADSQQYGTEELKHIREIRVELEKVRLLCERIIKREKVKKDLVLCSHEILASRMEYIAFTVFVRSSFPAGVSSESATTSIDNKSYSGTMQRSEDITVDSTVSGKRNAKISIDVDRKTDDSSTSRPPFKRKIGDRTFSGKQLPSRATSVPVQSSPDDFERRFKPRKQGEGFHKEVVMTSQQASMQNQRLPKGFVYVPVGSLSKEKAVHDSDSHEPEEPGG